VSSAAAKAYSGYAKRTMERALSATRKRHALLLANKQATDCQNGQQNDRQNAEMPTKQSAKK
jgi:hypothetical protein